MGLEYHLYCSTCGKESRPFEYSIVGYVQCKHPDECEEQVVDWTKFMFEHLNGDGHVVSIKDARGNHTDVRKIKGDYVLGLVDFKEGVHN